MSLLREITQEMLAAYGPILLACVIYGMFRVWQVFIRGRKRKEARRNENARARL